jgi:hypothetical protein
MRNDRLSRNKGLKIPKTIKGEDGNPNSVYDLFSVSQGTALARGKKFDPEKEMTRARAADAEFEQVSKIPEDSGDLTVMTKTKKLGAYIVAVTQKSPARFRGVFVNRMTNLCLDALQDMLRANFIRQNTLENKTRREQFQTDAIVSLKMLSYIALLAENAGCILRRQYKQISALLGDAVILAAAWRKSDNEIWGNRQEI